MSSVPMLTADDFVSRTSNGWPVQMDTSIYEGFGFECGCGQRHVYPGAGAVRELSGMRLIVPCPNGTEALTCVEVRGFPISQGFDGRFATVGPKGFVKAYLEACTGDATERGGAMAMKRRNRVLSVVMLVVGLVLANVTGSSLIHLAGWGLAGFGVLGIFGSQGRAG